jgi:hypothetical protein
VQGFVTGPDKIQVCVENSDLLPEELHHIGMAGISPDGTGRNRLAARCRWKLELINGMARHVGTVGMCVVARHPATLSE